MRTVLRLAISKASMGLKERVVGWFNKIGRTDFPNDFVVLENSPA